ncbi:hypothetical protein GF359_07390 [candidate division WOR-3 bacterium]|uniref:Uncharacterized protein n=1 Tax=candidate division WOR-3 bacterium TaxID=2052148 RepID=A0A9D5QCT8_UNCW3|nr:hypothetical protein [candidate division WOR-3 bacterium]MBD3365023.1 hypothetical protein [candidate division WOR-3 bacterium]
MIVSLPFLANADTTTQEVSDSEDIISSEPVGIELDSEPELEIEEGDSVYVHTSEGVRLVIPLQKEPENIQRREIESLTEFTFTGEEIRKMPVEDIEDLLRALPGIN